MCIRDSPSPIWLKRFVRRSEQKKPCVEGASTSQAKELTVVRSVALAVLILFVSVGSLGVAAQQQGDVRRVSLTAGRSTVLMTDYDITRIAITDPAIADAVVVQAREVLIDGKAAGTVSLIIWGTNERRQYDVVVDPGVSTLEQRLQALFPGEDIRVNTNGDAVILSGKVSSNQIALRAAEIATASAQKLKVVNLLQ